MMWHRLGLIGWVIVTIQTSSGWSAAAPARVKITSPSAGEIVQEDKVRVRVWFDARKAAPATGWHLTIDGKGHTSARFAVPLSYGQGSLSWDTRAFEPGVHAVRVKLYREGTMIGIAGVKVRLERRRIAIPESLTRVPASDEVKIISPRGGDEVRGQLIVTVQAQADRDARLEWIQLYADDRLVGLVNSPPYEFAVNTARLPDGEHLLIAVTVDSTDRRQRSAPVAIRTANGEQPSEAVGANGTGTRMEPLPVGAAEPVVTEILPEAVERPVLGQPDIGEPPEVIAAESKLLPPGSVGSATAPGMPIAPASLIKPYVPGRGAAAGDSSTVGAPGVNGASEEDESSPH